MSPSNHSCVEMVTKLQMEKAFLKRRYQWCYRCYNAYPTGEIFSSFLFLKILKSAFGPTLSDYEPIAQMVFEQRLGLSQWR